MGLWSEQGFKVAPHLIGNKILGRTFSLFTNIRIDSFEFRLKVYCYFQTMSLSFNL